MKNNKKKLLIAGGGYADIPLILSAKKLGYYVITSGNRPDEMGHKYSDEYRKADFSDREAILNLAISSKVSAICACCNDFPHFPLHTPQKSWGCLVMIHMK